MGESSSSVFLSFPVLIFALLYIHSGNPSFNYFHIYLISKVQKAERLKKRWNEETYTIEDNKTRLRRYKLKERKRNKKRWSEDNYTIDKIEI